MELGGILVYDCYARIETPNNKLSDYYKQNVAQRVNPHLLFTKEQHEQSKKELCIHGARERDFHSDSDKQSFLRLQRHDMKRELKAP